MQLESNSSLPVKDTTPIRISTSSIAPENYSSVVFDDKIIGIDFIRRVTYRLSPVFTQLILSSRRSGHSSHKLGASSSSCSAGSDAKSLESVKTTPSGCSHVPPPASEELNILRSVESTITMILLRLGETLHFCQSEVFLAIALIQRATSSSSEPLNFNQNEFPMIFLISLLLAHKVTRDTTSRNTVWCMLFGIHLRILNDSELRFLSALGFDLNITYAELESIRHFLIGHF